MLRGMVFSMAVIAAIFCLHLAMNMSVSQSRCIMPYYEFTTQQNACLSLIAIVDMNVHGPPGIGADNAKESSSRSAILENAMPGWAKYDAEDLPQVKHAFSKIFHKDPVENSGLSPLSDTPPWPDKSKLRNLRPPVRAAPHA